MFILSSKGKGDAPRRSRSQARTGKRLGAWSPERRKKSKNLYKIVDKWRVMVYNIVNNKARAERQKGGYMINELEYTLNLKRIDICDLLLALTSVSNESNAKKWEELHDNIKEQLEKQDEKQGY